MSTTTTTESNNNNLLSFLFRGQEIPVTYSQAVHPQDAALALQSEVFCTWTNRCEREFEGRRILIHSVEIQDVDMFGPKVGFVKINANCSLGDNPKRIPGICFLRGSSVAILVGLIEKESNKVYSILVDQPRVPVGQVSCLELPAGMIDSINDGIAGTAAKELEEECGIKLKASELTDLTALACQEAIQGSNLPCAGISPSPGGCDEFVRYMYVERQVSAADLEQMKGKLTGLNDHGEYITLRIVPMENMWKVSCDNKVICALFLAEQLRKEGKLPAVGGGLLLSPKPSTEPTYSLPNGDTVPALAFGLYKVPVTKEGGQILADAISNGYRHFDTASLYGNEQILGEAIRKSGIPREEFFVCSKVWNDAQKQGRGAVRESIENSLLHLNLGSLDCAYIHWPVPGHFVETYKELQVLHEEGKIRNIGLSNFGIPEYEELMNSESITIQPVINQIEVSPFMYRPATIQYFQERNILVAASKALHRASGIDVGIVKSIADTHRVTPAQVLVRYGLQKGLVPIVKTSVVQRMIENRDVMNFEITEEEMKSLDALTSNDDIINREELEVQRRCGV